MWRLENAYSQRMPAAVPRLKFLLIPTGSAGDVHPFIWLGKLLRQRGHEVLFIAQESVREMPERAGLTTIAWGDRAEQEAIIRNPDIWHPRKAFGLLARYVPKWAGESLDVITRNLDPGRTVLVGGALAFGARIVNERYGVPLLTVHLQPSIFMSVDESPVMMAGAEWLPGSPRWVRKGFFNMASWTVDRKFGPVLRKVRVGAGLPRHRIKGIMRTYWNSIDGVLCLFPEWFARKAPDWPPQAVLTRFPLYDESTDRAPDPELEGFMQAGEAPVVITPGSANAHAERFLRQAAEGVLRIGRRALIITRFPEQAPAFPKEEQRVRTFAYVPFSQVFPRAAAVIHHGGIGTTAQCFAAGVPQLIMPLSHDQPDNAARVKRLGAGDYLYPKKFQAATVASRLESLLVSSTIREACRHLRRQSAEQMSEAEMGELVESLSERALRVQQINTVGVLC
jgi:UDP:flavonoid glycosyltransferase YjiC (YdhE family)